MYEDESDDEHEHFKDGGYLDSMYDVHATDAEDNENGVSTDSRKRSGDCNDKSFNMPAKRTIVKVTKSES